MAQRSKIERARLLCGGAAVSLSLWAAAASAQVVQEINIAPQPLATALYTFAGQTGDQVMFSPELTKAKLSGGVTGVSDPQLALGQLLAGTGLTFQRKDDGYLIVRVAQDPQGASAANDGADVEALIVTAQKREEAIQDVPIAISAFTQKALEEQKIEGGFDLVKAIPNVTFSKSNFSGYNFSIRGIGTKAISATTDPGVAVAFNNTTLIQNRLFEQEYFDIERVEVLRGPQGTLYGRNATSGVINIITAKPKLGQFEGNLKGEIGSYDTRRVVGMLNVPLIEDVLAVRAAGALTQRTGYDYNEITKNNVNGRDLWSARVTVGFEPTPRLRANLVWERFEEDDNRSRTSKQLCHRDPGKTEIDGVSTITRPDDELLVLVAPAKYSQGCLPGSLYDDDAFGAVNGVALPFVYASHVISGLFPIGADPVSGESVGGTRRIDPYGGLEQSKDLRTIASIRDPIYRAKANLFEFSVDFDLTDSLTLTSQTAYNEDEVYSFQDYNRFNSVPIFTDTTNLLNTAASGGGPGDFRALAPGGVFCDPQIGCSDRIAGFDISQAQGTQFSQELRLQSNFDSPFNFSFGANYTKFDTEIDYYVMYNILTLLASTPPFYEAINGGLDYSACLFEGAPVPIGDPRSTCPYIDPNPVESIDGEGHNYFRSRNPYELESHAAFGEIYWEASDALKVTAGLRYTQDEKTFTPVPSQVLLAQGVLAAGYVNRGYPENDPIILQWGEWTGRLGVDWKPELGFTDETMLYAFYSRGYKGGGANPPSPGFATIEQTSAYLLSVNNTTGLSTFTASGRPVMKLNAVEYGTTFEPEFVNAFEVGVKNTLLNGSMIFNATAFYYDYKDYQVSQIRDRTAVNENFDAKIWGLEFEATYSPSRNLRFIANLGYLDTEIAQGERSIDIMNRTQGNPDYILVKPWIQLPSNCVVPKHIAVIGINFDFICGGTGGAVYDTFGALPPDPLFPDELDYNPANYPEINDGAGILAELGGNELPNAPHFTTNLGMQYGRDILDGSWRMTLRTDAYWQSQSWARVYNAVNDKLHGWYNLNLSLRFENPDLGVDAEFYVKNALDKSPITDAFINSDDSGLTTNVFVLDPRIVGFSLRKSF
jgi:iron complex outermembrane receptor protein